jgi:hypothetical protein
MKFSLKMMNGLSKLKDRLDNFQIFSMVRGIEKWGCPPVRYFTLA